MKGPVLRLLTYRFDLPLKHPFTISRSTIHAQPTLIVELNDGKYRGFGEATTNDYYGMTAESMTQSLQSVQSLLDSVQKIDPESFWEQAAQHMVDNSFALCALDEAACDLWGKQQGAAVYQLWGLDAKNNPPSCYTIGIDDISKMVEKLQEVPGWPVYKIKLGTSYDLEIIRELRKHTDAPFRVDANCGWEPEQTVQNSYELKELGVEFIEQPLAREDWDGAKHVFENSVLPILADESCISEEDVPRCHHYFHGVNIKLLKCGGLTPARRMLVKAKKLGMKTMVGCMIESSIGISAIAQLLPMLDYVDMDGAELLSQDIASGVKLEQGHCRYAAVHGTGAQLLEASDEQR